MEFCAIICEFNPFHNGHEYLIRQAKEKTGLPILCLMSGDFVQRGEPALISKYQRAAAAIAAGADMVAELPTCYAISSAEMFAFGAIKVLKSLGCSKLVVGALHTNLADYLKIVNLNQKSLSTALQNELSKGENYSKTLINITIQRLPFSKPLFEDASNILALEYIRQIKKQKANIDVILIERTDGGYNSNKTKNNFLNASQIRKLIANKQFTKAQKYIPSYATIQKSQIIDAEKINAIALYNLQKSTADELATLYDYSEGLPSLILNCAKKATNYNDLILSATSKRYRTARIKKLSYYPSINFTTKAQKTIKNGRPVVKMLAMKKDKKAFLSQFNKLFTQVIISRGDYDNLTHAQSVSAKLDLDTSNLYNVSSQQFNNDIKTGTIFCK